MKTTGYNEDGRLKCIDKCPKCGAFSRMQCIDSRMDITESVRLRLKKCACGHKYTTVEILGTDLESLFKEEGSFNLDELESLLIKLSTAEIAVANVSRTLSDTHKSVGSIQQFIKKRKKRI